jgi:serine/threonine-protein kinase
MDAHPFPVVWQFGPFELDEAARTLKRDGEPVLLGSRQVDTLLYLVANSDRVVTREELFAAAWPGRVVEDNNLTQAVAGLRRALGDVADEPRLIVTVKGRGYRVGVKVSRRTAAPAAEPGFVPIPPTQGAVPPRRWNVAIVSLAIATALAAVAIDQRVATQHIIPNRAVAILPIANLSGDPAQDYLADGITEELTDRLGRLPGLAVTGRLSARAFKGRQDSPADIAAALHATTLLEGSMRREGTHLTVLARLIDPATGYQTWAGRFDAADSGLLQVQQDLAERVAAGLSLRLTPSDHSALAAGQTTDPVALDAYLRAGQASRPGSPAAFQAAIGAYTSAIARDPHFAEAFLGRALARESLAEISDTQDAATLHALQAGAEDDVAQALRLAPALGRAQLLQSRLLAENHLDLKAATAALARGRALTLGDARAAMDQAMLEVELGLFGQAVADARRAIAADPLTAATLSDAAGVFFTARMDAEAEAALDAAQAAAPGDTLTDRDLRANLALARGDTDLVMRLCAAEADWEETELVALAQRRRGDRAAADVAIARLHAALGDTGLVQYADVAAQAGDLEAAMSYLHRAVSLPDPGLLGVASDRWLDPLRGRADFRALLKQLGLG